MSSRDPLPAGEPGKPQRKRSDRAVEAKTLAAIVIGALIIAFALANSQKVEIDFLVFHAHASLIIVIAISVVLGMALSALVGRRRRRRATRDS
jgi:uncharacterized integral membrane protein